jgi:hypothetical protein
MGTLRLKQEKRLVQVTELELLQQGFELSLEALGMLPIVATRGRTPPIPSYFHT